MPSVRRVLPHRPVSGATAGLRTCRARPASWPSGRPLVRPLSQTAPHTLVYRDEPEPAPASGEAIIRVEAVGICGSDMHAIHGHDARRPTPIILGHEAAGRVLTGRLAGKRVAVNPLVIPADCAFAREGRPHLSPRREILSMP